LTKIEFAPGSHILQKPSGKPFPRREGCCLFSPSGMDSNANSMEPAAKKQKADYFYTRLCGIQVNEANADSGRCLRRNFQHLWSRIELLSSKKEFKRHRRFVDKVIF
jgi:hypothetical protein